ncbi:MAG: response regulator [Gammaproteobacteria bacterium]|nr:response regulator [Gammaproteobacteria bacterium]
MSEACILLVDDDEKLTSLIGDFLRENGFRVESEPRGDRAIERIRKEQPRLVILDIMLPGADGLAVCRNVRPHYSGPILMLTALDDDIDEVAALELGADDYLGKPVKPRLLLAHVRALLRRYDEEEPPVRDLARPESLQFGPLYLNAMRRQASMHGVPVDLTMAEFDALWHLACHAGTILTRDELYRGIYHLDYDGVDRSLDLRISRLRKKLGDDSKSPRLIKTVRGNGYLFTGQP